MLDRRRALASLAAVAAGALLGGCALRPGVPFGAAIGPGHVPAVSNIPPETAVFDALDHPYTLDTGDRLRVIVFGQAELSNLYTIDPTGRISLPLIGLVEARGLTTAELESQLRGRLRSGFLRDPQVTVEVDTYRPFFVLGEVNGGGAFPYQFRHDRADRGRDRVRLRAARAAGSGRDHAQRQRAADARDRADPSSAAPRRHRARARALVLGASSLPVRS